MTRIQGHTQWRSLDVDGRAQDNVCTLCDRLLGHQSTDLGEELDILGRTHGRSAWDGGEIMFPCPLHVVRPTTRIID